MKYILLLCISLFGFIAITTAQNYEDQGTTVKKQGCDVMLIMQIALDRDSIGDVAMIQNALNSCFALTCDLPCADRKTGRCKIITKVVVVKWSSLSYKDQPKFHHVWMYSGAGISRAGVGTPNGKSTVGYWYRKEYSPKVYCHETMHLAGLLDHYRDCRAVSLADHVDNCKDGDTCTTAQKESGACPACKDYEQDIMGNDVRKPVDCNRDIVEIIRLANAVNPVFYCSDSCCEDTHSIDVKKTKPKINFTVGLRYTIEDSKPSSFPTTGAAIGIGLPIHKNFALNANYGFTEGTNSGVKYNKSTIVAGGSWFPFGMFTQENKPFQILPFIAAMMGSTSIKSTVTVSGNNYSSSASAFTYHIYAQGDAPFKSPVKKVKTAAFINAGILHTSFGSSGQNNINFDAGFKITLQ